MILDAEPDIAVVGEAGDGDSGVAMVRTVRPDVVLMDIRMPGTNGIDATAQIVREMPDSRVLILTTFDLDDYVFAALRAGASGFLLKDVRPAELLNAIRTVAAGEAVLAPSATRLLIERFVPSVDSAPAPVRGDVLAELTERERDVFVQIAAGRSNPRDRRRAARLRGHGQGAREPRARQARAARPGAGRHPGLRIRDRDPQRGCLRPVGALF
jgi:DNA-binding NarL/FixJ family response regulator